MFRSPFAANRPAVKSSESPGRKKPNSSPDSAKMIRNSPMVPKERRSCCGSMTSEIPARTIGTG